MRARGVSLVTIAALMDDRLRQSRGAVAQSAAGYVHGCVCDVDCRQRVKQEHFQVGCDSKQDISGGG